MQDSGHRSRKKTHHLDLRVCAELIKRLDAWRYRQRIPPSRTATVIHILTAWLDLESDHPEMTRSMGEHQINGQSKGIFRDC